MKNNMLLIAFALEIISGVLLYIITKEIIISLLLVVSGLLFLISGFLYNSKGEKTEERK